ncbi:MAG: AAA family ATPase [Methanoculleus sp.]|nr:AAA family ATPase [Methanoculleus sp.]
MGQNLDKAFLQLLTRTAKNDNTTVEKIGTTFASREIENRTTFYPQLKQVLLRPELDIREFKEVINNCWAATARIESIRFSRFIEEEQVAILAIQTLIKDFPQDDAEAAARINSFIDQAVHLGYKDVKDSPDRPGAAALCSVLLTSSFPDRFVDFKQKRWRIFAQTLDYDIPYPGGEYGQGIVWAGKFAAELVQTRSFGRIWNVEYPLWVVAGIAWVLPGLKLKPDRMVDSMLNTKENAEITTLLRHKKQVILYGPPGTGKTYRANNYISEVCEKVPDKEFVTFHPSFGYEDFIEGLRPFTTDDGTLTYRVEDGIFKMLSRRAFNVLAERAGIEERWNESESIPQLESTEKRDLLKVAPEVPLYLIIDEINRGDISRIFGELITLLEADKRYGEEHGIAITLPYSKEKFAIPPNLYIIGTMNTADKSISLVDAALRRRFGFIEMMPDYDAIRNLPDGKDGEGREIADIAAGTLETINKRIARNYDRDHQIGHSYLVKVGDAPSRNEAIEVLHFAWYHEIIPLLQEYYYDAPIKFNEVIGSEFVKIPRDEHGFEFCARLYGDEFLAAMGRCVKGEPKHAESGE